MQAKHSGAYLNYIGGKPSVFSRGLNVLQPREAWSAAEIFFVLVVLERLAFKRVLSVRFLTVPIPCKSPEPKQDIENPLAHKQQFQLLLIVDGLVSSGALA